MGAHTSWMVVLFAATGIGCAPAPHGIRSAAPIPYSEPHRNAITFWGHACAYVDVGGFGIVTDPVFSARYAVIRRRLIPAPPPETYDQTRVILISHAHQDHADPRTLARFSRDAVILAPYPAAQYLRHKGFAVRVMRPGDEYPFPGGTIIAVAAHHPGPRLSLKARSDGRAIGYLIRTPEITVYYTGDTDYFPGLASIGKRFYPEVTLLNLNAHLHSEEALAAIAALGMPRVIPMHLGAYDGKSERLGPGWRSELIQALGDQVIPLEVGQSVPLSDLAGELREP